MVLDTCLQTVLCKGVFLDLQVTKRPKTAGTLFKDSMIALVENLQSKEPFYVRCVKPNERKSPLLFDDERCQHQVEYLGLLENVRVRRAGYAYRMTYERFVHRSVCVCTCVCTCVCVRVCVCVCVRVCSICGDHITHFLFDKYTVTVATTRLSLEHGMDTVCKQIVGSSK